MELDRQRIDRRVLPLDDVAVGLERLPQAGEETRLDGNDDRLRPCTRRRRGAQRAIDFVAFGARGDRAAEQRGARESEDGTWALQNDGNLTSRLDSTSSSSYAPSQQKRARCSFDRHDRT